MAKKNNKLPSLVDILDQQTYQSDLEWHKEKDLREQLEKLEQLHPGTPAKMNPLYWELRGNILKCMALNAMEQFSRGKYDAGMITKDYFDSLLDKLESKEEALGFEAVYL